MPLTEEDKQKIAEEERYRAGVRKDASKGTGSSSNNCCLLCCLLFLVVFVVLPVIVAALGLGSMFTEGVDTGGSEDTKAPASTTQQREEKIETEECSLKAQVKYSDTQLEITNLDDYPWDGVKIKINTGLFGGGYEYKAPVPIEAGKTYAVGFMQFADSKGNRYDPFQKKFQNVFITTSIFCDYFAEVK